MNQHGMFYAQTSTPTPSTHQKLIEHRKHCMQNTQLMTKTLIELKDKSNVLCMDGGNNTINCIITYGYIFLSKFIDILFIKKYDATFLRSKGVGGLEPLHCMFFTGPTNAPTTTGCWRPLCYFLNLKLI